MSSNYNTRVISRIGFVTQDIKDLQFEILSDIDNRANEINNFNAECIFQARSDVETAITEAGDVIRDVGTRTIAEINTLNGMLGYPLLEDLELLVSQFEIEMLSLFRRFNTVTNFISFIIELETEVRLYGALFEYFVSEIYVEMIIHNVYTDMNSAVSFPQLEEGLEAFRSAGNSIRASLPTCN